MRFKWIGVLALLLAVGVAQAGEDRGWYIGVGAGQTDFETTVVQPSIPPQTQKVSDKGDTVRMLVGYRALKYLFIEGGYASYGNISEPLPQPMPPGGPAQMYEASLSGWDLSLVGNLPLAKGRFDIFAKLGVARTEAEELVKDPVDPSVARDTRDSVKQTSRLFGIGAQVH